MTCQILGMGHQGFQCQGSHRDISDACVAQPESPQRSFLVHEVRKARIVGTFPTNVCEVDRASLDDLQDETVTAILKVMFVTNELYWRSSEGANRGRT